MNKTSLCIVYSTTDSQENASEIASQLVTQKLAACVQIVPGITSVYQWNDGIEQDKEWLLLIKTHADKLSDAELLLTSLHSYDVPQWVVVEASSVSQAYGNWLNQALDIEIKR